MGIEPLLYPHVNGLARHLRDQAVDPQVNHLVTYVIWQKLCLSANLISCDLQGFRLRCRDLSLLGRSFKYPQDARTLVSKKVAEVELLLGIEEYDVLGHLLARHLGPGTDFELWRRAEVDSLARSLLYLFNDGRHGQVQAVLIRQVIKIHPATPKTCRELLGIPRRNLRRCRQKD